jgi:hypothetical protein
MGMLAGLAALGFVGFVKGSWGGRATSFWATERLVDLAAQYGVRLEKIRTHFKPEPPHNPLVLRGRGGRRGNKKIRGSIIKNFKHTEHTRQLEADLKELNAFLADCEIIGGEHSEPRGRCLLRLNHNGDFTPAFLKSRRRPLVWKRKSNMGPARAA